VAAFTSDVTLYEVTTQKGKDWEFNGVESAMTLPNGHQSTVNWICFSSDSKKLATASKDCTWKMWDINVRYHVNEDPKLLYTVTSENPFTFIAISPDIKVVATADGGGRLSFYAAADGRLLDHIPRPHAGTIRKLVWSPDSSLLASCGEGDKAVKLWHNPLATTK